MQLTEEQRKAICKCIDRLGDGIRKLEAKVDGIEITAYEMTDSQVRVDIKQK